VSTLEDDLWALALDRAAAAPGPTGLVRDLLWRSLHLSGWRPRAHDRSGPTRGSSDRGLLERFVHGDAEAFEALVERHAGALVAFAARSLPPEYAHDAVHEAFLALFSRAHEVIAAGERTMQGFLFRVVRAEVTKSLGLLLRDGTPGDGPEPEPEPAPALDPLVSLRTRAAKDVAALLHDACDPLEQQVVLMLLHERARPEIAAALDLEPAHVRELERRARAKLAQAGARAS
jgi:DNA-directed RNA polymerase specialized sigma24 family protein